MGIIGSRVVAFSMGIIMLRNIVQHGEKVPGQSDRQLKIFISRLVYVVGKFRGKPMKTARRREE